MDKKIEKKVITLPKVLLGIGCLLFFGFVGSQYLNNTGETKLNVKAVSYTHLTLPTIYSV